MTDTIETTENVFEAKARSIVGTCIPKMAYDSYLDGDYDVLVSAIAAALEAERLEERDACAKIASTTFMTMKGLGEEYFAGAEVASHNAAHAIRNRSTSA
jgi:hypothetical protein